MIKKSVIALAVIATSFAAQAVTVDLRHEFTDDANPGHKDRIAVSHRFENGFGFSTEAKFKNADASDKTAFNNIVSNGTEIGASYLFKFDNPFTVEVGGVLENNAAKENSAKTTYKPYVRAGYKISDTVNTNFRYRPYFERVGNGAGEDDKGYNLTWVVNWQVTPQIGLSNELDYKKSELYPQANGKKEKLENDLKVTYKLDQNWRPYVAVGNIAKANTDERQTRYRVGVQYVF